MQAQHFPINRHNERTRAIHLFSLTKKQHYHIRYWIPALLSGGIAWLAFLFLGNTPLVRASGLALVIVGVALSLRKMSAPLSLIGSLSLAFSEAFWSQAGGGDAGPATITIAIGIAGISALLIAFLIKRPEAGLGLGIIVFAILFWSQIGTPQSLRLTSFVMAWLMYLLIDMLLLTNPRPDGEPPQQPRLYHTMGIPLLFGVGVLNDPLLTLLAPAILFSLALSYARLPKWYWIGILLITVIGLQGIYVEYIIDPRMYIDLSIWRDANRWLKIMDFIISQFSIIGLLLSILGLSRLSRWYPSLGTMTMVAYGAFAFFGLVYIGPNREALLLPMLIIQVTWLTYAVSSIGQWITKNAPFSSSGIRWLVPGLYLILPLLMLWSIVQTNAS